MCDAGSCFNRVALGWHRQLQRERTAACRREVRGSRRTLAGGGAAAPAQQPGCQPLGSLQRSHGTSAERFKPVSARCVSRASFGCPGALVGR